MLIVDDFFKPDGFLAKAKSNFVPRKGQQELAQLIFDSIENHEHVIAEAPTGFGKSFTILVPAIIKALENKKRIVISTETLNLQQQYLSKDLPLLQKVLAEVGRHFTFAEAKGRSNFICKKKLAELPLSPLVKWANKQDICNSTGELSTVDFEFDMKEWQEIGADEDCEKRGCPLYGNPRYGETDCFIYKAQYITKNADIIVSNHKLTLLDIDVENVILNPYDVLMIDEAHSFAEIARDTWGITIKPRTVSRTLQLIRRMLMKVNVDVIDQDFIGSCRDLETRLFEGFLTLEPKNLSFKQINSINSTIIESAADTAVLICQQLKEVHSELNAYMNQDDIRTEVVIGCKKKLAILIRSFKCMFGDGIKEEFKDNWIAFADIHMGSEGRKYAILNLKMLEIAPLIRSKVYDPLASVIALSATLKVGDTFSFIRKEFGMPKETKEFTGESSFNFKDNVQGYFPIHLPDSSKDNYLDILVDEIEKVINKSKGRALILFTNISHMKYVYNKVNQKVKYNCLLQGTIPKGLLVQKFEVDTHSCLFATKSFFYGVDFVGETLSCLILVKAPFQNISDPLFIGRCDKIDKAGYNSFVNLSMPLMIQDFRQAFGRLIRSEIDKGIFAFLDSRANIKPYGKTMRKSLPSFPMYQSIEDIK